MKHSANSTRNIPVIIVVIYSFTHNLMWNFSLLSYHMLHDMDEKKSCMEIIKYSLCRRCNSLSLMSVVEILAWRLVPNNVPFRPAPAPSKTSGAAEKMGECAYRNTPHWIFELRLQTEHQNFGYFMPLISDCKQDNGASKKRGFLQCSPCSKCSNFELSSGVCFK